MQTAGIFVVLALICSVSAQIFNTNATQLSLGQSTSSSLVPQPASSYSLIPDLYYVYVPENTASVNVTLSNPSTTGCSYTYVYVSAEGFTCASDAFGGSATYACSHAGSNAYVSSSTTSASIVAYAGDNNGYVGARGNTLVAGGFYYITVSRYYSSDYNTTCPYTIGVTSTNCSSTINNTVAVGDGSSTGSDCTTYIPQAVNFNATFNINGTNGDVVYKLTLPQSTGNVHIRVGSNNSIYVYGASRVVTDYSSYTDTNCYSSGNAGTYIDLVCYGVVAGSFFIVIESDYALTGNISVVTTVCNSQQVGTFCNDTFFDFNQITSTGSVSFNLTYNQRAYGYFDTNAAVAGKFLFVSFTGISYIYFGRDAYPTSSFPYDGDSIGFTPVTLNNFAGGVYPRYYFYAPCTYSAGCAVRISSNATQSTTGSASTRSMTTAASGSTMSMTTAASGSTMSMTTAASGSTMSMTTASATTTMSMTTRSLTTARVTTSRASTAVVLTTNSSYMVVPSMIVMAIVALLF